MTAQDIRLDEEASDDEIHLDTPFMPSTLAWQSLPAYHESHAPLPLPPVERRRLIVRTVSMAMTLLALSAIFVAMVLLLALPPMTPEERAALRVPHSFHQLQQLGEVFSKYNEEHMGAVMTVWVTVFLLCVYSTYHQHPSLLDPRCHVHDDPGRRPLERPHRTPARMRVHCQWRYTMLPSQLVCGGDRACHAALAKSHRCVEVRHTAVPTPHALLFDHAAHDADPTSLPC